MTDDSVMVLFQRVPSGMGYLSLTAKGKVSIGIPTEYRLTEYRLIFNIHRYRSRNTVNTALLEYRVTSSDDHASMLLKPS